MVDAASYTDARNRLNTAVAEHESKYSPEFLQSRLDFNFGENIMMRHAKRHLDIAITDNDPPFIDGDGSIKHQTDIVKNALLQVPKTNYSDL